MIPLDRKPTDPFDFSTMSRKSLAKNRVEERHLPKDASLETLLKPRQVALHPDQKAKEYVDSMYSFDVISDYAQNILDALKSAPTRKSYNRQKYVYQLGFVNGVYKGSVDYPTALPTTSDFCAKDIVESEILNEVIQLLQPVKALKKQVALKPKATLPEIEVDDIFEDVGTDYVITTNRNRTHTVTKASLSLSEESENELDIPINLEVIKSKLESVQNTQIQNSDSESDHELPLLGEIPQQLDSYDYIDSGSEEDEAIGKKPKSTNLDNELKRVSGVYHQKYGEGLVEEKAKKRSNTSELNSHRKRNK
jgi:hypothetical protein